MMGRYFSGVRSQQAYITLSLARYTVTTMEQCIYMVIANTHASSNSRSNLFLNATPIRFMDLLKIMRAKK
nr:hypothetical protein Iba_scaffold37921CG0390 [Ipomoea batatas]GMD75050.1 hypothetical protein Iba_chr13aCG11180 [Ipomoea batatas]